MPQGVTTRKGVLMGDPGSKIILTILTKCVDSASRGVLFGPELRAHPFQTAGDDQICIGSIDYLRKFKQLAPRFSVVPSEEKWGIFRRAAPFCEQAVTRGKFDKKQLFKAPEPMLDFLKCRLLSRESKLGMGVPDQDTNPAIGKCFQFSRMLSWIPEKDFPKGKVEMALKLFVRNLWNFLPRDFHLGLPT